MEDRVVHREMTKGEGESEGMESEDEGKERDEKEKIMQGSKEGDRRRECEQGIE